MRRFAAGVVTASLTFGLLPRWGAVDPSRRSAVPLPTLTAPLHGAKSRGGEAGAGVVTRTLADTPSTGPVSFIGKFVVACRSVRGAESIGEDFPVWLAGRAVRFSQNLQGAEIPHPSG